MALNFLQQPPKVSLAGNPVIYQISSNRTLTTGGATSRQFLEMTGFPGTNETFTLQWMNGGIEIDFIIANVINDDGKGIPTGSGNFDDYLDDIFIPALQANYLIDRDFAVFRISYNIFFESRERGSQYTMTYISGNQSWNNGFTVARPGADRVYRPNFKLLLHLYLKYRNENDYRKIELDRFPQGTTALFDLSEILSTQNKLILPDLTSANPVNVSGQIIDYYIKATESYGEPPEGKLLRVMPENYAICGGFSQMDSLDISFQDDFLPKFLTHGLNKRVRPNQPVYLTFFNKDVNPNWAVSVDLMSGGQSVHTDTLHIINVPQYEQILIPCGYQLAMATSNLAAGTVVDQYRIWIQAFLAQEPTTNVISFEVQHKPGLDEVYLAYQTSFNTYETFVFLGERADMIEFEEMVAEVIAAHDTPLVNRLPVSFNKFSQYSTQLNTDFLTEEESHEFHELLNSKKVYLIWNNRHIPVKVSVASHNVKSTDSGRSNPYTITLKFIPEKFFSNVGGNI